MVMMNENDAWEVCTGPTRRCESKRHRLKASDAAKVFCSSRYALAPDSFLSRPYCIKCVSSGSPVRGLFYE